MFSGCVSRRVRSCVSIALAILLPFGVVGCGRSSNPFEMIPVSGKIATEDGSPIAAVEVQLRFEPQMKATHGSIRPKIGTADVIDVGMGNFSEASTQQPGDGLIAGKHVVRAYAYDASGQRTELSISPAEITVGSDTFEFEFRVKRK